MKGDQHLRVEVGSLHQLLKRQGLLPGVEEQEKRLVANEQQREDWPERKRQILALKR